MVYNVRNSVSASSYISRAEPLETEARVLFLLDSFCVISHQRAHTDHCCSWQTFTIVMFLKSGEKQMFVGIKSISDFRNLLKY